MAPAIKRPFRKKINRKKTLSKMRTNAVRSATTAQFNKRVLAVVNRNLETKMRVVSVYDKESIHGSGLATTTFTGGTTPITPVAPGLAKKNLLAHINLDQGVEQEQRIGNSINNVRLRVRGFIQSAVYNSNTNASLLPYEVHMLVYKRKRDYDNPYDILKSYPNNATGQITSDIITTLYPFNKDSYEIKKHRVFRMRPMHHEIAVNTTTGIVNSQNSNALPFQRFNMDIPIKKTLRYSDGLDIPANDWVGILFFVINGDGSIVANPVTNTWDQRALVSMDAVLTYKDA